MGWAMGQTPPTAARGGGCCRAALGQAALCHPLPTCPAPTPRSCSQGMAMPKPPFPIPRGSRLCHVTHSTGAAGRVPAGACSTHGSPGGPRRVGPGQDPPIRRGAQHGPTPLGAASRPRWPLGPAGAGADTARDMLLTKSRTLLPPFPPSLAH